MIFARACFGNSGVMGGNHVVHSLLYELRLRFFFRGVPLEVS